MSGKPKPKTQRARNARPRRSTQAKNKNSAKSLVLYTTALVVLFLAIFMINRAMNDHQDAKRYDDPPSIVNQPVIGSEQAKVTLIEFGDYKCPSCKQWSERIYPQLKAQYIDSGQAKLAFINTLFHGEESRLGALAGEAVLAQNKEAFWEFNEAMFAAQPDYESAWLTEQKIKEVADSLPTRIDAQKLMDDVANGTTSSQVDLDTSLVNKYRINQTPTLIINGTVVKNPFDINEIKSIIDQNLGD
ncbi:DsbA family protein [Cohnella endophytica]|nr:thioredoxin domain-containing protein [Cohnella endophytica]